MLTAAAFAPIRRGFQGSVPPVVKYWLPVSYSTGKFILDILNGEDMIVFNFKPPQIQHGVALVGATRRCKCRDRRGGCKLI